MDLNEMVDGYIKCRDAKAMIEADCKNKLVDVENMMAQLEARILAKFQELGVQSARTPAGTAYINTKTKASVADRDAFLKFVKSNEAWDMLESRCKKEAVAQWKAANGDIPPGLNWYEERTVGIRRS